MFKRFAIIAIAAVISFASLGARSDEPLPTDPRPRSNPNLTSSFRTIKTFARDQEIPAAVPVVKQADPDFLNTPIERPPLFPIVPQPKESSSAPTQYDPATGNVVWVNQQPVPMVFRKYVQDSMEKLLLRPLLNLPEMNFSVETGAASQLFSSPLAREFARHVYQIVQGMALPDDGSRLRVIVTSSFIPNITVESNVEVGDNIRHMVHYEMPIPRKDFEEAVRYYAIKISVGTLAFVENRDELAAVIAQALAQKNPKVWGFHDDPRLKRRLQEQIDLSHLDSELQNRIKADASAIERVKSLGLRPWALTDYELRILPFFRDVISSSRAYAFARSKVGLDSTNSFTSDKFYEIRIVAQKIVVSYMQERENLQHQIQTVTPFDSSLRRVHQRAKSIVGTTFNFRKKLRNRGLLAVGTTGLGYSGVLGYELLRELSEKSDLKNQVIEDPNPHFPLLDFYQNRMLPALGRIGPGFRHAGETIVDAFTPVADVATSMARGTAHAAREFYHWGHAGFAPIVKYGGIAVGDIGDTMATAWNGFENGAILSGHFAAHLARIAGNGIATAAGAVDVAAKYGGHVIAQVAIVSWNGGVWTAEKIFIPIAWTAEQLYRIQLGEIHDIRWTATQLWDGTSWTLTKLFEGAIWTGDEIGDGISASYKFVAHAIGSMYPYIQPGLHSVMIYGPPIAVGGVTGFTIYKYRSFLSQLPKKTAQYWSGKFDKWKAAYQRYEHELKRKHKAALEKAQKERAFADRQAEIRRYIEQRNNENISFEETLSIFAKLLQVYYRLNFYQDAKYRPRSLPLIFDGKTTADIEDLKIDERQYWSIVEQKLVLLNKQLNEDQFAPNQIVTFFDSLRKNDNPQTLERFVGQSWIRSAILHPTVRQLLTTFYRNSLARLAPGEYPGTDNSVFNELRHLVAAEDLAAHFTIEAWLATSVTSAQPIRAIVSTTVENHLRNIIDEALALQTSLERRSHIIQVFLDWWPESETTGFYFYRKIQNYQISLVREGRIAESVALSQLLTAVEDRSTYLKRRNVIERATDKFAGHRNLDAVRQGVAETALLEKIAQLSSIHEIVSYIDSEVFRRGGQVLKLTPELYTMVIEKPDLIQSMQDALALLSNPYFWPRWKSSSANVGELEGFILKVIQDKQAKYDRLWRYEPRMVETLHHTLVDRLKLIKQFPNDYVHLKTLWFAMTDTGVTAETDRILQNLIGMATDTQIEELKKAAVDDGRIWETDLHSRLAIAQVKSELPYRKLLAATDPKDRAQYLREVIESLGNLIPERGLSYVSFLEQLSVDIHSSFSEAKTIAEQKAAGIENAGKGSDSNFDAMKSVFNGVKAWDKNDQLNFLLFVRGEAQPSKKLLAAFRTVGLERVRRMFEVLPVGARVGLLDTFFTHSLIGTNDKDSDKWTKKLTSQIIGGSASESQVISHQLLTAFLHAVDEVGNGNLATTILSYLYALPSSATSSPGETLKHVLEVFGATGIKVGQFLLAAQILPPEEAKILRSLQDRAKIPARMEIYEDVIDILGTAPDQPLPFTILDLLGAASLKYAFLAEDSTSYQKLVVKIFRLEAKNNVDMQFDVLKSMSRFLVANYGPKYGVLDVILEAAQRAVNRERLMQHEIYKSQIARNIIYVQLNSNGVEVEVPQEDLIKDRMIVSQYAEGVSFNEVPDKYKRLVAQKILSMEAAIMFADSDVIRFDPDRHAGNYRIWVQGLVNGDTAISIQLQDPEATAKVSPIDFGQMLRISADQRERVIQLFALAQIASKVGVNEWLLNKIRDTLRLTDLQTAALRTQARRYLQAAKFNPVTVYISLLAAVKASGYNDIDISYIDFIRGIIQLTQYESYAGDCITPSRLFEQRVWSYLQRFLSEMKLSKTQANSIRLINAYRTTKGYLSGTPVDLIPSDLSKLNFSDLIRRDETQICEELLATGS